MTTALTCPRCLAGTHRCLTRGCACSCNRAVAGRKTVAGGVLRAPIPGRAGKRRVAPSPTVAVVCENPACSAIVPAKRRGRPHQYCTPACRPSAVRRAANRANAAAELAADPTGKTWSMTTHAIFRAETERVAELVAG